LGGDFYMHENHYRQSLEILSRTKTRDGIFGVDGNHDWPKQLFAAKQDYGIVPLVNSGLHIHEGFYLAGVEDLWYRRPCINTATAGAASDDFVLLLSHVPDISMKQDTTGLNLILSGHTHGGQVTLFGLWAPYLTFSRFFNDYGQRFRSGWAKSADGVPVYVSNGISEYGPRVFARPQVIVFTLYNEQ
jgi:hypothetical protein